MPTNEVSVAHDAEIAAMLRAGNEEGLRHVLRIYGPRVKWLLRDRFGGLLADPDLAAVLNEAVLKVYTSIELFDPSKGTLGAWFWRIAMNTARDVVRGERRHAHENLTDELCERGRPQPPDEEEPAPDGMLEELQACIRQLPDLQRKIIQADLACGDVASSAWLAQRFSTSETSIRVSRKKAHEHLRKAMRERGYYQD